MTMNKKEIISKMAEFTGSTKLEAEKNLEALFKTIEFSIENNEKFNLVGYFSLDRIVKPARKGRNPKTGEEIQIPAKGAVKFKCGKVLADLVNK